VSDATLPPGPRAAAEYLRQLLLKPGRYQDAWREHVGRAHDGVINQLAVTEVLARHLRAMPRGTGDVGIATYQLRETVSQALAGRQLSQPALELFIGAFRLTDDDAARAWRLWNGATTIRVLAGERAIPAPAEQSIVRALGPRRHQTLSLNDHVWVGPDGRIDQHHVIQVIEATADCVDRIPFLCTSDIVTLEVGRGCTELSGELHEVGEGVFLAEILLARALRLGETTTLEYWITWAYPGDPDDPQEREYRRAAVGRFESYELRIEFHPDKLPADVWWAQWDGTDGDVLARELAALDSQHSAQRYLKSLEKTVVGFYWTWPTSQPGQDSARS
jgi:hypothetical protein